MDISKIDLSSVGLEDIKMPLFFSTARELGIDLKGSANRENNARAILTKIATLDGKALEKVPEVFRRVAENTGVLKADKKAPKAEKEADKSDKKEAKADKKTETKAPKTEKKTAVTKADSTAAVKVEEKVPSIKKATLDKLIAYSTEGAEKQQKSRAEADKIDIQMHGCTYARIQDLAKGGSFEVVDGEETKKYTNMDEYLTAAGWWQTFGKEARYARQYALIWRGLKGDDGKIPQELLERVATVQITKVGLISALPDIKEALVKGVMFNGKRTPLEKLTKREVEEVVTLAIKGAGRSKSSGGPKKHVTDIPKLCDPILKALPKIKSAKIPPSLKGNTQWRERLNDTITGLEKSIEYFKEIRETLEG